mmetsp:Transcript_66542/g.174422  ORF Transcript_66542/g.174422 Transcript_66542/m.174422 type:complete len:329 (+) Transcript_66542:986-1972(+)
MPVGPDRGQAFAPPGRRCLLAVTRVLPRRNVAHKVVEQRRVPVAASLQVVEVEVRGDDGVERVGAPGDGRQHGRDVADHPDGPRQGARAVLLEGPGAFPQHLRVFAVGRHGGEDSPDTAPGAADRESVLLPGEREERLGPDPLQLHARPVPSHRVNDAANATALMGQEAGAHARNDQNAFRQDVRPVHVEPHHNFQDLECVHGHAVVAEELADGGQRRAGLELDACIVLKEAHGLEHPPDALEGPDFVQAPAQSDDTGPMRRCLPCPEVHPPEDLAPTRLDVLVLVVVLQHRDEVGGLELLQKGVHAAGVVPGEVVQDAHATMNQVAV